MAASKRAPIVRRACAEDVNRQRQSKSRSDPRAFSSPPPIYAAQEECATIGAAPRQLLFQDQRLPGYVAVPPPAFKLGVPLAAGTTATEPLLEFYFLQAFGLRHWPSSSPGPLPPASVRLVMHYAPLWKQDDVNMLQSKQLENKTLALNLLYTKNG